MSESASMAHIMDIYKTMSVNTISKASSKVWLNSNQKYAWLDGQKINANENMSEVVKSMMSLSSSAFLKWKEKTTEMRLDLLYKIAQALWRKQKLLSMMDMKMGAKNNSELFASCFNYYSDYIVPALQEWYPVGVVVIKFSGVPAWLLALNVAAAFYAGCAVIVITSHESEHPLLLAETCKEEGLPDGIINVISENVEFELRSYEYGGLVWLGKHPVDGGSLFKYFGIGTCVSCLTVNHTSSIILETCDLEGAVDKIFSETWANTCNSWGVKLVIVQESIYEKFLSEMARKIENFMPGEPDFPILADQSWKDLNNLLSECSKEGAEVLINRKCLERRSWGPILVSEYQVNYHPELPVMTLHTCRTASEAVVLANNSSYSLGTSVWTEDLSQGLDVASNIDSTLVWINCHGLINASVSFEPSRMSGVGCFGGEDGAMPFLRKYKSSYKLENLNKLSVEHHELHELRGIAKKSFEAFTKWKLNEDRKYNLKKIVSALNQKGLSKLHSTIVEFWSLKCKTYNTTNNMTESDVIVIRGKKPIGVILLVLSSDSTDIVQAFVSLVTPALALGNVVIVLTFVNDSHPINSVISCFTSNMPAGVLTVINGLQQVTYLARDPHIGSVWSLDNDTSLKEGGTAFELMGCKHFWSVPKWNSLWDEYLFWKKCLKNKSIWMTKASH